MSVRSSQCLFIHVPKTGGIWTTDVLLRNGGKQEADQHEPRASFLTDTPVFSNVRDPWRWYASWYSHTKGRNEALLKEYGRGSIEFRAVLYGLTHSAEVKPEHLGGYWPPRVSNEVDLWKQSRVGFCSYVFRYMWADASNQPGVDVAIPTDRLQEGTELFLSQRISGPPLNVNKEATLYTGMYDEDMIQWVKEADRFFIDRFQFQPFESSPEAIYYLTDRVAPVKKPWYKRILNRG